MQHDPRSNFMRRVDPERNMARFYILSIQPSLFGDIALVREWGRIETRGRARIYLYEREEDAEDARDLIAMRKRRRGYADRSQGLVPLVEPAAV